MRCPRRRWWPVVARPVAAFDGEQALAKLSLVECRPVGDDGVTVSTYRARA